MRIKKSVIILIIVERCKIVVKISKIRVSKLLLRVLWCLIKTSRVLRFTYLWLTFKLSIRIHFVLWSIVLCFNPKHEQCLYIIFEPLLILRSRLSCCHSHISIADYFIRRQCLFLIELRQKWILSILFWNKKFRLVKCKNIFSLDLLHWQKSDHSRSKYLWIQSKFAGKNPLNNRTLILHYSSLLYYSGGV